jgi:hypothetical protein
LESISQPGSMLWFKIFFCRKVVKIAPNSIICC